MSGQRDRETDWRELARASLKASRKGNRPLARAEFGIAAELERVPEGVELPEVLAALNQRQRPPRNPRTLTPSRKAVLERARQLKASDPNATQKKIAASIRDALEADEIDAPESVSPKEWQDEVEALLAEKALPMFLKRHLTQRSKKRA